MKELKFNIIKFNNGDIIVTSICPHIKTSTHVLISRFNYDDKDSDEFAFYDSHDGELYQQYSWNFTDEDIGVYIPEINSIGWWHYDEKLDKYVPCNDSDEHPFIEALELR